VQVIVPSRRPLTHAGWRTLAHAAAQGRCASCR